MQPNGAPESTAKSTTAILLWVFAVMLSFGILAAGLLGVGMVMMGSVFALGAPGLPQWMAAVPFLLMGGVGCSFAGLAAFPLVIPPSQHRRFFLGAGVVLFGIGALVCGATLLAWASAA